MSKNEVSSERRENGENRCCNDEAEEDEEFHEGKKKYSSRLCFRKDVFFFSGFKVTEHFGLMMRRFSIL